MSDRAQFRTWRARLPEIRLLKRLAKAVGALEARVLETYRALSDQVFAEHDIARLSLEKYTVPSIEP